jgi:N-acetylneuraminic acid mutarotase
MSFSPAPDPRQEIQPAAAGGRIYLVGGLRGSSFDDVEVLSSVDVYHPATDVWTAAPPLPDRRHHVAVASANGRLYACGGMTGEQPSEWTEQNALHELDPGTGTWRSKTSMPSRRGEHLGIAFDGKLYFIGGRAEGGEDTGANEVYDPASETWAQRAPMPTPRRSFAAAALDTLIYVVGGRRLAGEPLRLVNTTVVEAYSPSSDRWYVLAGLPVPRGGLALGVSNGKLYAMGGEYFSDGGGVFDYNHEYTPATNSWRSVSPMARAVHGTGAVTLGETIYVLGGATRVGVYSSDLAQGFVIDP